jgi:rRNA maturation endonuclease Nob1
VFEVRVEKVFGACGEKLEYVVLVCNGCGQFLIAQVGQKTKNCNYCGASVALWKAKKIANVASAREASRIVKELKMKKGS